MELNPIKPCGHSLEGKVRRDAGRPRAAEAVEEQDGEVRSPAHLQEARHRLLCQDRHRTGRQFNRIRMGRIHFSISLLRCLTHVWSGTCECCHLKSMTMQTLPLREQQLATLATIHRRSFL